MHQDVYVEVRIRLVGVGSFLPGNCGSRELSSGPWAFGGKLPHPLSHPPGLKINIKMMYAEQASD